MKSPEIFIELETSNDTSNIAGEFAINKSPERIKASLANF